MIKRHKWLIRHFLGLVDRKIRGKLMILTRRLSIINGDK